VLAQERAANSVLNSCQDENLKPKSPPYRGAHIDVRWQDKNKVGLAARGRLMPRTRPGAYILHCDPDALHAAELS